MDDDPAARITEADMDGLNRRALLRSTYLVRQAAQVLFLVALLLVIAWLWSVVRYQQFLTDNFNGGLGVDVGEVGFREIPLPQRIDAVATSLGTLAYAAIVAGIGLALRLYGEVVTLRDGGANITPWELGDLIDDPDEG
jgi:hypothetical protein